MGTYMLNFTVYTTAMIGVIFLAIVVYKKFSYNYQSQSKFLNVEDCVSLAPRKTLYVIKAGEERFLVASDAERTSLISKLGSSDNQKTFDNKIEDLPEIVDFQRHKESKKIFKSIMNNL